MRAPSPSQTPRRPVPRESETHGSRRRNGRSRRRLFRVLKAFAQVGAHGSSSSENLSEEVDRRAPRRRAAPRALHTQKLTTTQRADYAAAVSTTTLAISADLSEDPDLVRTANRFGATRNRNTAPAFGLGPPLRPHTPQPNHSGYHASLGTVTRADRFMAVFNRDNAGERMNFASIFAS